AYHHKIKRGSMRFSELDDISGIGPRRKRALLTYFKSIEEIKQAAPEDLLKVKGINRKTAENILRQLGLTRRVSTGDGQR
ncbi:MAG: helix-hairpin-helix domain-containing protein, partial [Candidatus Omnitrophota bacterium]